MQISVYEEHELRAEVGTGYLSESKTDGPASFDLFDTLVLNLEILSDIGISVSAESTM